jgi:hypothetical protein
MTILEGKKIQEAGSEMAENVVFMPSRAIIRETKLAA